MDNWMDKQRKREREREREREGGGGKECPKDILTNGTERRANDRSSSIDRQRDICTDRGKNIESYNRNNPQTNRDREIERWRKNLCKALRQADKKD